jgi:hypothetical protein
VISPRHLRTIACLLALALIPTVIHSYVGMTVSDGRTTAVISRSLAGMDGIDTNRSPSWAKEHFRSDDFIERRYGTGGTLFVARGYDAKALYHHPELAVAYARSYDSATVQQVSTSSASIPVHVLTGLGGLACYVLLYEDEFIERPMLFHAGQALAMLFGPRKQTTLFFAHGPAAADPSRSPVMQLLLAAVESFQAQPPAASR